MSKFFWCFMFGKTFVFFNVFLWSLVSSLLSHCPLWMYTMGFITFGYLLIIMCCLMKRPSLFYTRLDVFHVLCTFHLLCMIIMVIMFFLHFKKYKAYKALLISFKRTITTQSPHTTIFSEKCWTRKRLILIMILYFIIYEYIYVDILVRYKTHQPILYKPTYSKTSRHILTSPIVTRLFGFENHWRLSYVSDPFHSLSSLIQCDASSLSPGCQDRLGFYVVGVDHVALRSVPTKQLVHLSWNVHDPELSDMYTIDVNTTRKNIPVYQQVMGPHRWTPHADMFLQVSGHDPIHLKSSTLWMKRFSSSVVILYDEKTHLPNGYLKCRFSWYPSLD